MARKVKLEMNMKIGKKKTTVSAEMKHISTNDLITFMMGLEDAVKHRLLIEDVEKLSNEIIEGK